MCSCQRDPGHLVSFNVGMADKNYPKLPLMASLAILCQARPAKCRIWPNTGMHTNKIHAMLSVYKWRCVMYCTSGMNQWMLGGYLILLLTAGFSFWRSRIREPWILVFLVLRNTIKEPWVLVISKTSKNWQFSSQNQWFYRPSFSIFQKFENYIYIYMCVCVCVCVCVYGLCDALHY